MGVSRRFGVAVGSVLLLVVIFFVGTPAHPAAALTGPAAATATKTKTRTSTKTASLTPTVTLTASPTRTATPYNPAGVSIAAGDTLTCVVDSWGRARCVGGNTYGELGQGDTAIRGTSADSAFTNVPYIPLGTGAVVKSIKSKNARTCALLSTGSVKCWGIGDYGALGYASDATIGDGSGEMGDNLAAVSLPTGRTAIAIGLAYKNTCAILDNGSLICWGESTGHNDDQRHGETPGTMGDNLTPINLGTGRTVTAVDGGDDFICALLDNGQLKCFGSNYEGVLGIPTTTTSIGGFGTNNDMGDNLAAIELGTGVTVTSFGVGRNHTCALLSTRALKCWGMNDRGQLGNGTVNSVGGTAGDMGDALPAVDLGTGRYAVQISVGAYHTCALLDNAAVKCWGWNAAGSLGAGTSESFIGDEAGDMGDALVAVDYGTTAAVESLAAGRMHTCALFSTKTIRCLGFANTGALGYGDSTHRGSDPSTLGANLPSYPADASTGAITMTPTKTLTPSITATPTITQTPTNTLSPTLTSTSTPTATRVPSTTRTPTKSPTRSKTPTKSRTPTKKP